MNTLVYLRLSFPIQNFLNNGAWWHGIVVSWWYWSWRSDLIRKQRYDFQEKIACRPPLLVWFNLNTIPLRISTQIINSKTHFLVRISLIPFCMANVKSKSDPMSSSSPYRVHLHKIALKRRFFCVCCWQVKHNAYIIILLKNSMQALKRGLDQNVMMRMINKFKWTRRSRDSKDKRVENRKKLQQVKSRRQGMCIRWRNEAWFNSLSLQWFLYIFYIMQNANSTKYFMLLRVNPSSDHLRKRDSKAS